MDPEIYRLYAITGRLMRVTTRPIVAAEALPGKCAVVLAGLDTITGDIRVRLARADDSTRLRVCGWVETALSADESGDMVIDGPVVSGKDQSQWAVNAPVYLANDGTAAIVGGTNKVEIGRVMGGDKFYFKALVTGAWG